MPVDAPDIDADVLRNDDGEPLRDDDGQMLRVEIPDLRIPTNAKDG